MDHDLGILGFLNSPIYASPQFSFIDPPSLSNHVQASELEDTTMETHGSFIFRGYNSCFEGLEKKLHISWLWDPKVHYIYYIFSYRTLAITYIIIVLIYL